MRDDVVRLFEYINKEGISAVDKVLSKEVVWGAIFPGKRYDDAFMRQVMYFLLRAIEDYLVFSSISANRVVYQHMLTSIYRQRKLEKSYRQSQRMSGEYLEQLPLRNSFYLQHRFQVEHEEYNYQIGISQNALVNLQESSDAFETWFLSEKLKLSCEMQAHQAIYQKVVYRDDLLESVLDYASRRNFLESPAVAVFYYANMAVRNPEEEMYFDALERLILDESKHFTAPECRQLYLVALNYCIQKVNQQRQDFARRAFDLYVRGLNTGILLENNLVSRYTFGNAVGAALRIKEFRWAEQFVQDYAHYLDERERKSIVNFNMARVYYATSDYTRAQKLLMQFEYNDLLLNIIAKTMLLKIYFEQSEFDAFESLLESLRIYLQRKEALDNNRKQAFKNMISLMKKLLKMSPISRVQRDKLRELVTSTQPLMERDWLLQQLEVR
jgi:hypothetical protein